MAGMDLRAAVSRMPVDRAIDAFMASHYGLTTVDQVLEVGGTRRIIEERVHRGRWVAAHRGVFRDAAAPKSAEQELLAAVFAAGDRAQASHLSGVWLWNLLARPPVEPFVSVPYADSPTHNGIRVHRATDLVGAGIHERRGIPVTDPARSILDAAAVAPLSLTTLL